MEKAPLLPHVEDPAPRRPAPIHSKRAIAAVLAMIIGTFWLTTGWECGHGRHGRHVEVKNATKVPLEVHIMSKCPDARDCLKELVLPAMANVSDKVDFRLSFIGKTTDEDDGVQCMHGQTECLGNILLLCAASEYPDPKIYLGFTMCLERDYKSIPKQDFVEDCALEHGINFGNLNDCMSKDNGAYGMGLLRKSVTRSADLGVTTSCTVRLDGKTRCVRDGGKWRDCDDGSKPEDLIHDINEQYNGSQY